MLYYRGFVNSKILKLYRLGIKWNTLELIITQSIFFIFQLLLFKYSNSSDFLNLSAITSLMFFFVPFVNLGMDQAIIVFFEIYKKNKASFNYFFIPQLIVQILISIVFIFLFLLTDKVFGFLPEIITYDLKILLCLSFFLETIKKLFRTLLQVYFKNSYTAITEILSFFIFLIMFMATKNTLLSMFVFAIVSTLPLIFIFLRVYRDIPNEPELFKVDTRTLIFKRASLFIYRAITLSSSSNFLIPLITPYLNPSIGISAYFLKNILNAIRYFSEKVLGITSAALITRVKNSSDQDKADILNLSLKNIYKISGIVLAIAILCSFYPLYAFALGHPCDFSLSVYYAFLLLLMIDVLPMLFIPQEKFLIIEDFTNYVVLTKAISLSLFYLVTKFYSFESDLLLINTIGFTIQLLSFLIFNKLVEYLTKIKIINNKIKYLVFMLIIICAIIISIDLFAKT